jgi:hypothetical protein
MAQVHLAAANVSMLRRATPRRHASQPPSRWLGVSRDQAKAKAIAGPGASMTGTSATASKPKSRSVCGGLGTETSREAPPATKADCAAIVAPVGRPEYEMGLGGSVCRGLRRRRRRFFRVFQSPFFLRNPQRHRLKNLRTRCLGQLIRLAYNAGRELARWSYEHERYKQSP